jgi:hypothetical protein
MLGAFVDVSVISKMHKEMIAKWHGQEIANPYEGLLHVACQQLSFNFLLWHEEDKVRDPSASPTVIAEAKRKIDQLNQQRNDWIERIDDAISEHLLSVGIQAGSDVPLNSESVGSIVDRLSILSLRIYHLEETLNSPTPDSQRMAKATQRLTIARDQHRDLSEALRQLVSDIDAGRKRHKTYRQLKLYNDPLFNPYLAGQAEVTQGSGAA